MKGVLSGPALSEFNENGFVRTGIFLPATLISRIRDTFASRPETDSNWSYFALRSLTNEEVWLK